MALDLVVFDWDGTLMDSTGAIAHSIQSERLQFSHASFNVFWDITRMEHISPILGL